jgi:hypothetical protein
LEGFFVSFSSKFVSKRLSSAICRVVTAQGRSA